ncbi:type IV secretory system conjugative DNA transfer family protein [Halosegnis longus]|uniref:type IV secretory system conjugative DNA transfer family protein n=1 Tax=Halosegnis longus TaxID=2216012 RepID=UPI00129E9A9C|nr:type IV secretion system DNA-binding domain-containing protein [Halosegnis longus]
MGERYGKTDGDRLDVSNIRDGDHVAVVSEIVTETHQSTRTAHLKVSATGPEATAAPIDVAVPCDALDVSRSLQQGSRLRLSVRDGKLTDATFALDKTIRAAAAQLPTDRYAVPVTWSGTSAGQTQLTNHVQPLARNHSLLVTGEPGAGKTEFIKLLLPQIEARPDEPVVVFNFKDDYSEWALHETNREVVRLSLDGSTDYWNIFREVEDEDTFAQLGHTLFDEAERTAKNPFFPRTARQLTVAVMTYLHREAKRSKHSADNRELVSFLNRFGNKDVHQLLDSDEHADLRGAISAINPDASKQSVGVYSTLQSIVQEVLTGDFAAADGEFSIREYIENPDNRLLLLDYPIREGDRMGPIYKFFIDRAIQLMIDDPNRGGYFVLDEFARVPQLEMLDTLVATGRAQQTQAILGVQSLSQLAQQYGDATVDSILSGLTQEVHLRSGDQRTVEYVRDRLGTSDQVTYSFADEASVNGKPVTKTVSSTPMTGQLQRLGDGEAIIYATRGWVHAKLPMWNELSEATQRELRKTPHHSLGRTGRDDD